eukprot:IDg4921t1
MQNALAHYEKFMKLCSCSLSCNFLGSQELSLSFAQISEAVRVNTVRCMLLVLSAAPDCRNDLMTCDGQHLQARKRLCRSIEGSTRTSTGYAIRGIALCASAFAEIEQFHP